MHSIESKPFGIVYYTCDWLSNSSGFTSNSDQKMSQRSSIGDNEKSIGYTIEYGEDIDDEFIMRWCNEKVVSGESVSHRAKSILSFSKQSYWSCFSNRDQAIVLKL